MKLARTIYCSERKKGIRVPVSRRLAGFTLLEMLMVITIIAILARMTMPHLTGMTRANSMSAALQQLLDDVSYARQKALSIRSPVYVVFISPQVVWDTTYLNGLSEAQRKQATNLAAGQYTTYTLYSPRTVGDQPGAPSQRYLTQWRTLPDGVFISTNKFDLYDETKPVELRTFCSYERFPFPFADSTNATVLLPCIKFNSQGQLVSEKVNGNYVDAIIPLARGSIFHARDAKGNPVIGEADVLETPPGNGSSTNNYNRIHIGWVTGRGKIERPEIPD